MMTSDLERNEVAALRAMDESFLQKPLGTVHVERDRLGRAEEIGQPARDIRVFVARVSPQVSQVALMENDDAFLLACQSRVQKLAGERPARVRQDNEGDPELAAL